jgi:hypothetical protein
MNLSDCNCRFGPISRQKAARYAAITRPITRERERAEHRHPFHSLLGVFLAALGQLRPVRDAATIRATRLTRWRLGSGLAQRAQQEFFPLVIGHVFLRGRENLSGQRNRSQGVVDDRQG